MIKNKEISSAELTKSVFDRIKAVEGKVDAYLTLDEENAMKKAAEIDEKLAKGEELSPLQAFHLSQRYQGQYLNKGSENNLCVKNAWQLCSAFQCNCNEQA